MTEIVIFVDGPEPFDLDRLVLGVLIVRVPDIEATLHGGTTFDVDVFFGSSYDI